MSCDCNTLVVGEAGPQGPQGLAGTNGTNGTNGINAFTTVSGSGFIQPSENATVTFTVANNEWIAVGQPIYISDAGFYEVSYTTGVSSVTAILLKQDGIAPTGTVAAGKKISPSAIATYSAPLSSLTVNISPATTILNGSVTVNQSGYSNGNLRSYGTTDNSLLFVNASLNRVGVGISSPAAKLHVSGDFQVGVASSTGGGSVAAFTKGATFNSLQGGTGFAATDFIVKTQNVADTLYVSASSDRVGVGTTTPAKLLDIDGTGQTKAWIVNPGAVASPDGDSYVLKVWGSGNTTPLFVADATNRYVGVNTGTPAFPFQVVGSTNISGILSVTSSSMSCLVVDVSNRYVGINISSPTVPLHVSGSSSFSGAVFVNSLASFSSIAASNLNINSGVLFVNASSPKVGVGTSSPTRTLSVTGSSDFSGNMYVSSNIFVVDTALGRVGVNTSTPSTNFEVNGSANVLSNLFVSGNAGISGALFISGSSSFSKDVYIKTNLFVANTTNNRVGINTSSPSVELHVSGAVQANSYQIASGAGKITQLYHNVGASSAITLAAGSSILITDTVTGAAVGDMVLPSLNSIPATTNFTTDVVFNSKVVSADTINTVVTNLNVANSSQTYTDTIRFNYLVIRASSS